MISKSLHVGATPCFQAAVHILTKVFSLQRLGHSDANWRVWYAIPLAYILILLE